MLYYRATHHRPISLATIRLANSVAFASYPAGALTLAWTDSLAGSAAGFGLILLSLIAVVVVTGSSLQRIVGEKPGLLDEYELKLRARAMGSAYTALSVLALLLVIYAAIASDKGFWLPSSYDEYNGLFWGAFLYTSLLPGAFLAWQIEPADVSDRG